MLSDTDERINIAGTTMEAPSSHEESACLSHPALVSSLARCFLMDFLEKETIQNLFNKTVLLRALINYAITFNIFNSIVNAGKF